MDKNRLCLSFNTRRAPAPTAQDSPGRRGCHALCLLPPHTNTALTYVQVITLKTRRFTSPNTALTCKEGLS